MRILIVGAGISGLSMALALEKIGIKPEIIEKHPSLRYSGAGIALPMNAVELLFNLGLKEKLMEIAYVVKSITYALPDGEILSKESLLEEPLGRFPFIALHRKNLLNLLASSISTKIEFNTTIHDIRIDTLSKKITTVKFNNGETATFDLIISADGLSSQLRTRLTKSRDKEDLGLSTWRFIANIKQDNPVYYFGKTSVFMIYPISYTQVYCYAHILNKSKINLSHKEHLSRCFGEYPAIVNWIIQSITQENIISGRLESITTPLFRSGNVAFIGDAAHACSPMLQQGAAKGLEDAITLSAMLKNFPNLDDALLHYEKLRRPRVEWITHNSDIPIKNISSSMTDSAYNERNTNIKRNGPVNIQKWKILFSESYLQTLDNYLDKVKHNTDGFAKAKL